MSAHQGLAGISTPDLLALGRTATAAGAMVLSESRLMAAGLGHIARQAPWIAGMEGRAAAAVVEAVLAERDRHDGAKLELVWTGPEAKQSMARDTAVVLQNLFGSATRDVLVAGYSWDHGADILRSLHEVMKDQGVTATFFLDVAGRAPTEEARDDYATAAIDRFFRDNWPFGDPKPTVYYDPRTTEVRATASIHAKCVVVDARHTLITSANFTDRGQTRNIEVGVLIDDPTFAEQLLTQWRGLIANGLVRRYVG